jgi:5'-nucleotidase
MNNAFARASVNRLAGVWACALLLLSASSSFAADVTLLYTGETHSMLYPCSCPIETDGGIARRATLIKSLRKASPNVLLVDSGAFFGGGLMDEYTQSTELDMARTQITVNAMDAMKYDAAVLGDEEFNFGRKFLEDMTRGRGMAFLSSNSDCPNTYPSIIKAFPGARVGIIAATPLSANPKAGGITISDPKPAIARAIANVKAGGADIVVLLSHLGEADDLVLLKAIDGIDVVVSGGGRAKQESSMMVGKTLLVRPSWQGRRLGKVVLSVKDGLASVSQVEEIRLSDKVADDKDMLALGPQCFSDSNCKKGPRKGVCQNPGARNAQCVFPQDVKVPLIVIAPKNCPTCQIEPAIESYKNMFPGLDVTRLSYPGAQAQQMIDDFRLPTLPAYIFGKSIEQDPGFAGAKEMFMPVRDSYLLKPQFGGVAFFLGRPFIANKIDVFLSLYDPNITTLLFLLEEFDPQIHFLAGHKDGQLAAPKGTPELEEMKRGVCVKKYYPAFFWNYLNCRVRNIESSWWQDCLGGLDPAVVKTCAQGQEGTDLLEQNIALNEELQIVSSPTYVVNNQSIFSSQQPPSKEEFRKIFTSK